MDDFKPGLVSVVMPAFNSSDFIGEAIESVLSQTYSAFELLIVYDKSSDNSLEIISKLDIFRMVTALVCQVEL